VATTGIVQPWRGRRRARRRAEAGFTVIELLISMAMLSVVMLMGFDAEGTVLGVGNNALGQSQATTVVALAMTELRQEAVSANILFNPSTEGSNAGTNPDGTAVGPGFSLRIYTQTNGIFTCVQWRLLDTGDLQLRSWSDQWQSNGVVRDWTTLLTGIVNPASQPPFVLDTGSNYGGSGSSRLLDVNLVLKTANPGVSVQDQASIAGRDAEYYPQNTGDCSPVPTSDGGS
jgi:prepilin-type N-terminal cleavage/methylation domain-containing protein